MTYIPKQFSVTPVGTSQIVTVNFNIVGVKIDNKSGMWLKIVEFDLEVPPNTLGWANNLEPSKSSVNIMMIDTPTGGAASAVTGNFTVTVYDIPIPVSVGANYAPVASTADITGVVTAVDAVQTAVNTAAGAQATAAKQTTAEAKLDTIINNTNPIQAAGVTNVVTVLSASTTTLRTTTADESIILENPDTTVVCYWGFSTPLTAGAAGANVSLNPGEKITFDLAAGLSVYARVVSGTLNIKVTHIP